MATSLTIPATIYRPERPKSSHELVEYCSTIFDTSLDDADRTHTDLPGGQIKTPPDQERARKMADYAVRLMRSKGDHLAMMRKHIASLGLTLPRLMRLNRFARSNALPCYGNSDKTRAGALLVHRAALSMLLDVPARNASDAMALAEMVRDALAAPEKAQQRRVAMRLARYFTLMLANVYRYGGGAIRPDSPYRHDGTRLHEGLPHRLPALPRRAGARCGLHLPLTPQPHRHDTAV